MTSVPLSKYELGDQYTLRMFRLKSFEKMQPVKPKNRTFDMSAVVTQFEGLLFQ